MNSNDLARHATTSRQSCNISRHSACVGVLISRRRIECPPAPLLRTRVRLAVLRGGGGTSALNEEGQSLLAAREKLALEHQLVRWAGWPYLHWAGFSYLPSVKSAEQPSPVTLHGFKMWAWLVASIYAIVCIVKVSNMASHGIISPEHVSALL